MLGLVFYAIGTKGFRKKIGYKKLNGRIVLTALSYLVIMFVVAFIIGAIFYATGQADDLQKVPDALKNAEFLDVLITLLIGSVVEEIFFRGYLQKKTNILFSTFVFAYFHIIYGSLAEIIGAFFLGLILAYSFKRTKNLYVPTISHILYNLITVTIIFGIL
jgi:hypothetical protein